MHPLEVRAAMDFLHGLGCVDGLLLEKWGIVKAFQIIGYVLFVIGLLDYFNKLHMLESALQFIMQNLSRLVEYIGVVRLVTLSIDWILPGHMRTPRWRVRALISIGLRSPPVTIGSLILIFVIFSLQSRGVISDKGAPDKVFFGALSAIKQSILAALGGREGGVLDYAIIILGTWIVVLGISATAYLAVAAILISIALILNLISLTLVILAKPKKGIVLTFGVIFSIIYLAYESLPLCSTTLP
ncbi:MULTISPECIES: hypothetical protein [Pseudomonas]|uniref:hypothetical protein n=1 Tax=Pseudomonas TaxID=286 RepID=UPI0010A69422|nr:MULTISPECIES: hypothetical protein [Pseudomonas]WKY30346.1 hypothetical protein QYF67_10295 [Pseudomonas donghuensis]